MKKILEIDRCIECNMVSSPYENRFICMKKGIDVEDVDTIPDWCPLPDAKSGQEDNEK